MDDFELGLVTITEKARQVLHPQEVFAALWNHSKTDDLEISSRRGAIYVSAHTSQKGAAFWIRTESDHSLTTVYLPEESDRSGAGSLDAWVLSLTCPGCGL